MNNPNYQKYLSSFDVTRFKRAKLWAMLITVICSLILIVIIFRPKQAHFIQKKSSSLIQVKSNQDDFQKWTLKSTDELNTLKKSEQTTQDTLRQANTKINTLNVKLEQQQKLFHSLLARFKLLSHPTKTHPNHQRKIKKLTQNNTLLITSLPPSSKPLPSEQINNEREVNTKRLGWLPVGSFFTATLLNGVDAGTGTHAQANPQPVLMRVDSNAFLPNEARYRIQACFVLGSAYGSLPSERALIRTARISCVSKDRRAIIDSALKGYVVDLDGKMGLRGHLINKQGAKLAKAMLAGFFGGLSDAVTQIKHTVIPTQKSIKNAISPSGSLQIAGFSSLNNATKELTHFYINEAKRLFPVIEVNAGRKVVINLSHGIALQWQQVNHRSFALVRNIQANGDFQGELWNAPLESLQREFTSRRRHLNQEGVSQSEKLLNHRTGGRNEKT